MEPMKSLTLLDMFLAADVVVQTVIIGLLIASLWSWAIILEKSWRIRRLRRRADAFDDRFWSGGSLDDLFDDVAQNPQDPMQECFVVGMREWRQSTKRMYGSTELRAGISQRVERVMTVTMERELASIQRHLSFLATLGSTAPFVGLFATVWGIMNSFQAIAVSGNTSLAVVAPGIAEALFATAVGLIAAIPAVVAYNALSTSINGYASRLGSFLDEFSTILNRHLEERM